MERKVFIQTEGSDLNRLNAELTFVNASYWSFGKLTLKEKGWENEIHSSQSFFYIAYYLYYIVNSDKQLFTFCISLKIFWSNTLA